MWDFQKNVLLLSYILKASKHPVCVFGAINERYEALYNVCIYVCKSKKS